MEKTILNPKTVKMAKAQDENYAKEYNKEVEYKFDYSLIEDEKN